MEQIGLIGYGSMADMIARQLLKHEQIKENELFIETRTKGERLRALMSDYPNVSADPLENWANTCQLILICVPPLHVIETMRRLYPYVNRNTHIVSIAAGVPLRLWRQKQKPVSHVLFLPLRPKQKPASHLSFTVKHWLQRKRTSE